MDQLLKEVYGNGRTHFQEMSTGQINATELAASLICSEKTIPEASAICRMLLTVP